jgi:hypothetical protein
MADHATGAGRVPEELNREAAARSKFACPACGAEAVWNPGKRVLACPFCGKESEATPEIARSAQAAIAEHDLLAALGEAAPAARGWGIARTSVRCRSCDAVNVFEPERVGQRCEFCGSSALVPYEEIAEAFSPESLLPMTLGEAEARDRVRGWFGTRWLAPGRLKRDAMIDRVHGLYVPYWTFDAAVVADWTAESGTYYYVTERRRGSDGRTTTQQVRKVRWTQASGRLQHAFDDLLVAASKGVDPALLRQVEPFPTRQLVPYDPGFLAGWVVERYQIDLRAAAEGARERMERELEALCGKAVPGDTYRNLRVHPDWSGQTYKHILVPIWLLGYQFGRKTYQVVVNGATGTVAGRSPLSPLKIALLALAALVALYLVAMYVGG